MPILLFQNRAEEYSRIKVLAPWNSIRTMTNEEKMMTSSEKMNVGVGTNDDVWKDGLAMNVMWKAVGCSSDSGSYCWADAFLVFGKWMQLRRDTARRGKACAAGGGGAACICLAMYPTCQSRVLCLSNVLFASGCQASGKLMCVFIRWGQRCQLRLQFVGTKGPLAVPFATKNVSRSLLLHVHIWRPSEL